MESYDDVDQWGRDYAPQSALKPGPEVLPAGLVDCVITSAGLARVGTPPETIFRLGLRVLSGPATGVEIERPTFFRRQESLDYLGGDMLTLGVADAGKWGRRGKTWSQELSAACGLLLGKRLRAQVKHSRKDNGKEFHDFIILAAISAPAPVPAGVVAAAGTAPSWGAGNGAAGRTGAAQGESQGESQEDDSIPF